MSKSVQKCPKVSLTSANDSKVISTFSSAGPDWVRDFYRRHGEKIRKYKASCMPAGFTFVSIQTQVNWLKFLQILSSGVKGMENIFEEQRGASRIWNCDETGFQFHGTNAGICIWAEKGSKRVKQCYSGGKTMITVVMCGSAAGQRMNPFVIYPSTEASIRKGIGFDFDHYPGASFHASETGWMNRNLFPEFIEHFHREAQRMLLRRPLMLILDGAAMHISAGTIERAQRYNIELFLLPPNATSAMQPMDISVMGPLKIAWREERAVWTYKHLGPDGVISKKNFLHVLKPTIERAATPDNIKAGFRKAGIYPLNVEKPKENKDMFLGREQMSTITDARVLQDIRTMKKGPQYISYGELPAKFFRPGDNPKKEIQSVYMKLEYHKEGEPTDELKKAITREVYTDFVTSRFLGGVEYRLVSSDIPRLDDSKRQIVQRVKVHIVFKSGDMKVSTFTPMEWAAATGSPHEVHIFQYFSKSDSKFRFFTKKYIFPNLDTLDTFWTLWTLEKNFKIFFTLCKILSQFFKISNL